MPAVDRCMKLNVIYDITKLGLLSVYICMLEVRIDKILNFMY